MIHTWILKINFFIIIVSLILIPYIIYQYIIFSHYYALFTTTPEPMFSYVVGCSGGYSEVAVFLRDNGDVAIITWLGGDIVVLHKGFLDSYLPAECGGLKGCVLSADNATEMLLFLRAAGVNVGQRTRIIIPSTLNRSIIPGMNLSLLLLFPFSKKYLSMNEIGVAELVERYFGQCVIVHNFISDHSELLARRMLYIIPTSFISSFVASILVSIFLIITVSTETVRRRVSRFLELFYSVGLSKKDIYIAVFGFASLALLLLVCATLFVVLFHVEFIRHLMLTASLVGLVAPATMMLILYRYDLFSLPKLMGVRLAKIVLAVSIPIYVVYALQYSLSQFDYLVALLLTVYAVSILITSNTIRFIYTFKRTSYIGASLNVVYPLVLYLSTFALFVILPASYVANIHGELGVLINSAYPDNIDYIVPVSSIGRFYNYSVITELYMDEIDINGYKLNIRVFAYFGKPRDLGINIDPQAYPVVVLYNPCIPFNCPVESYNGSTVSISLIPYSSMSLRFPFKAKLLVYNRRLPPLYFETLGRHERPLMLNMFKKYPSLFYYGAKRAVVIASLNYFIENIMNRSVIDEENYVDPVSCDRIGEKIAAISRDPAVIYINYSLIGNKTISLGNYTKNICYLNISMIIDERYYYITEGYYVIKGDLPPAFHNCTVVDVRDTRAKLFEYIYSNIKPIVSMFTLISTIASIGAVLVANNLVAMQEPLLKLYTLLGYDRATLLKGVCMDYLKAILVSSILVSLFGFAVYHFYIRGSVAGLFASYLIQMMLLFIISFTVVALIMARRSRGWN